MELVQKSLNDLTPRKERNRGNLKKNSLRGDEAINLAPRPPPSSGKKKKKIDKTITNRGRNKPTARSSSNQEASVFEENGLGTGKRGENKTPGGRGGKQPELDGEQPRRSLEKNSEDHNQNIGKISQLLRVLTKEELSKSSRHAGSVDYTRNVGKK